MKSILLILLSWILAESVSGQLDFELTFQDMDELGLLPNNFINDMEMDDLGVLWVATNDGLCRYDSPNSIRIFRKGEIGIESDLIRTIVNGSDSTLWIGSTFGGVTQYNYYTNEFRTFSDVGSPRLSDNEILSIAEVSPQEIWIGSEAGLDVLFPAEDSIYRFDSDSHQQNVIEGAVLDIYLDQKGWIWISTWDNGIYLYLPDPSGNHSKGSFRKIVTPNSVSIWKILQHDSDHYWLATHNRGLGYMSISDDATLSQQNQDWSVNFELYTAKEASLTLDYLTDLSYDDDGNLWIATNNGLNILPKDQIDSLEWNKPGPKNTPEFYSYYHRPQITTSLNDNNITSLFIDKQGLIWIGSSSGINQFNKLNNRFTPVLLTDIVDDDDVASDRVSVMTMVGESILLLGTSDHGLLAYDLDTKSEVVFTDLAKTFNDVRVSALYRHDDERVYIGTNTGVFAISLSNPNSIIEFDLLGESGLPEEKKSAFFVTSILKDSQGRLWAGSETDLFLIDESTHSWERTVIDGSVTKLFEDSEHNIWYTSYTGLKRIPAGADLSETVTYMKGDNKDLEAFTSNHILTMDEYDKKLYFGTVNGLFVYDMVEQKFENFEGNGLQNVVNNLIISPQGILWMSSTSGIMRCDLNTGLSKMYMERDGIQLSSIRSDAYMFGPDSQIFFGCNGGFLSVNESDWNQETTLPVVYVTEVIATNINGIVKKYRTLKEEYIELAPNDISVEFKFASNNYSHPQSNTFAYRLDGFQSDEWNYTTDEKVTFTNLDHGEYNFHIKTSDSDGNWRDDYLSIKMVVKPKLVETTTFKVLSFLAALALMYLIVMFYVRSTRRRNAILQEYNKALEERDVNMQKLLSQLDKSNKDLTRSNKELAQYAYITSHDLQEPLRTVGAFAGLLKIKTDKIDDKEIKEVTSFIQEGVLRMSSLIKSLLNYSLISKDIDHFETVDLNRLVEGKILDLKAYIDERNAEVIMGPLPSILCLKEQIGTVFYNLILNGIKFNKSDKPRVMIDVSEQDEYWQFNVSDNGIGIPEEHQKKIFEIFTRLHLKEEYEGTGIGLAICNKIIGNHQGTISLISSQDKGSRFSFTVSKHLSLSPIKISEGS